MLPIRLTFLAAAVSIASAAKCPQGWGKAANGCYWGSLHDFNFQAAQKECPLRDSRAKLATIKSAAANAAVQRWAVPNKKLWINLKRKANGQFSWGSGEALTYTNWKNGVRPTGNGELCGYMNDDGTWSGDLCDKRHLVACSFQLPTQQSSV